MLWHSYTEMMFHMRRQNHTHYTDVNDFVITCVAKFDLTNEPCPMGWHSKFLVPISNLIGTLQSFDLKFKIIYSVCLHLLKTVGIIQFAHKTQGGG
jgi:hypothetical protein